jgi:FtsP/CotA-like multicopper oxidase with cupredoxin domain
MSRLPLTRRTLLAGACFALGAGAAPALAAKKHGKSHGQEAPAEATPAGTPLPVPPLVDLTPDAPFDLVAMSGRHAFLAGKPVDVVGYGGGYMGPALRLRRGATVAVRLLNRLERPTNVHWHGLLVDGRFDGGATPPIAPGGTWEARLAVDQPAATLWYHAHVHGSTTRDVHDGLAGLLIVEDGAAARLGLPTTWGVDDLPLVLQDRDFDESGRPVMPPLAASLEHGFRGHVPIVNGVAAAVARVPARRVRLRLLNASGARTFRLAFDDHRSFHLVAVDAGLLPAPIELTGLPLAPGERAEILVDFAAGPASLTTEPDVHEHRMGTGVALLPDVIDGPTRLVAFEPHSDQAAAHAVPASLAVLPALPASTLGIPRRRFELRIAPGLAIGGGVAGHDHAGHGAPAPDPHAAHMAAPAPAPHAGHGAPAPDPHAAHMGAAAMPTEQPPRLTINGVGFAMGRIDETVKLGATEIWEIASPDMAHPFHLHGAHFRVLSEDGERPKSWNGGFKDTVLVENSAELLVTFTRPADADAPFVYHCHLLEHEDGGMMGAFTVT